MKLLGENKEWVNKSVTAVFHLPVMLLITNSCNRIWILRILKTPSQQAKWISILSVVGHIIQESHDFDTNFHESIYIKLWLHDAVLTVWIDCLSIPLRYLARHLVHMPSRSTFICMLVQNKSNMTLWSKISCIRHLCLGEQLFHSNQEYLFFIQRLDFSSIVLDS